MNKDAWVAGYAAAARTYQTGHYWDMYQVGDDQRLALEAWLLYCKREHLDPETGDDELGRGAAGGV